jgi:hypothetical protein
MKAVLLVANMAGGSFRVVRFVQFWKASKAMVVTAVLERSIVVRAQLEKVAEAMVVRVEGRVMAVKLTHSEKAPEAMEVREDGRVMVILVREVQSKKA